MPFNMFEIDMSSLNISLKKVAKDGVASGQIDLSGLALWGYHTHDLAL